jgi:hypothetical protein
MSKWVRRVTYLRPRGTTRPASGDAGLPKSPRAGRQTAGAMTSSSGTRKPTDCFTPGAVIVAPMRQSSVNDQSGIVMPQTRSALTPSVTPQSSPSTHRH